MKKSRKVHSKEFKEQAVALMETQNHTELAAQLGVHISQLYNWREQVQSLGKDAFPGSGNRAPVLTEVEQLRKELALVKAENEFLKKTALFFAKNYPST